MNDQPENQPDPNPRDPTSAILWLIVGLLPIPMLLAQASSHGGSRAMAVASLIVCVGLNLAGGLGCAWSMKDPFLRIFTGLCLAVAFFVVSLVAAAFAACSKSGPI